VFVSPSSGGSSFKIAFGDDKRRSLVRADVVWRTISSLPFLSSRQMAVVQVLGLQRVLD